jgi:hypothetical protein
LFPEGSDEGFAALGSLELGAGKSAEFGEIFRTEVWHVVLLPMGPQVLDRIELWRVGREEFKLYVAAFALDVVGDLAAAMGLQTIPNDEEPAGSEMAPKIFEKGDDLGRADGAFDELEVDVPESDARHGGELVPCEAILQTGVLPLGAQVRTR